MDRLQYLLSFGEHGQELRSFFVLIQNILCMPRELESLVLSTLERKVMKHKEKRYAALEAGPERSLWGKKNTHREK